MKLNGKKLIDARHRKGLTQEQVAEGTGLHRLTINNAENGESIWPKTGKLLCEFLQIDLAATVLSVEQEGDGDAA